MFEFEIMWDDLTEEAKQEIREKARDEGYQLNENDRNWDVFPIATVEIEVDERNNDNDDLETNEPDVSTITIDGLSLDMNTLRSRQELIDYLTENGPTHSALMDFCDEYRKQYLNELCWSYPISDGKHLGTFLVLVKEGVLSLPYDDADQDNYELFCLEDVCMFDAAAMDEFIEDWKLFSNNLLEVMVSMRNILAEREIQLSAKKNNEENFADKLFDVTNFVIANKVRIIATRYANNGNLSLSLETDEHEAFATITVNTHVVFTSKSQACVDINNCPWAEKFIEENELGVFMGSYVKSGYCEYPVYEFFLNIIQQTEAHDEK